MRTERIKELLQRRDVGAEVALDGWVKTRRDSKAGFSFLEVSDGSTLKGIQVLVETALPNYEADIRRVHTGTAVSVVGTLAESPGKEQAVEVKATSFAVVGDVDPETYPLQKKRHTLEFLRDIAHLRPRTNTIGAVARVRNRMAFAIHEFFQQRGFVYVHTPIVTASDCEGAGAMFGVSTLDPAHLPRGERGEVDWSHDFFGRRAFLTVSGQLEGEAYALAMKNIYTFGPTFRAENSNTTRHLAEFWMIEPEMAFCDLAGDADLAEEFIKFLFRAALDDCAEDLAFFEQFYDKTLRETLEHIASSPFERVTYTEAVALLEKSGKAFEFPVAWGSDLQTEHERFLTEEVFRRPVVVTDYPAAIKAFYMRLNDDARTVAAMDILVPKIGEIVGGSQREERLDVLERRMTEAGLPLEPYWWYRDLRRFGGVPHAGFGLGFERTIQFVTGLANIRDVIPFPRAPKSCDF